MLWGFLKHSLSASLSLGTFLREQPSFVSLRSHGWLSSPWFVTSAAPQLVQLITEEPNLWQRLLASPWPLTSDQTRALWGSAGRHYTLMHLSPPVSTPHSIHSYSLSAEETRREDWEGEQPPVSLVSNRRGLQKSHTYCRCLILQCRDLKVWSGLGIKTWLGLGKGNCSG